jgi:hypothetical protein
MTTEQHDPWALLREALPFVETVKSDGVFGADDRASALLARIDAALAVRQDKPPCSCGQPYPCMKGCPDCCHSQGCLDYCQGDRHAERLDSAKDVVESDKVVWLHHEGSRVWSSGFGNVMFDVVLSENGWKWVVARERKTGVANTHDEAKAAAIAAARGL